MPKGLAMVNNSAPQLGRLEVCRRIQHGSVERCDVSQHRNEMVALFQREGKAHIADRISWYYRNQGQETPVSWVLRQG